MKKTKYRLQLVLDVRDRAKWEAARRVALGRAQLAEAEAVLARCEQAVIDCRNLQKSAHIKMMEQISHGTEAHRLIIHRTYSAGLRHTEQELIDKVREQQAVVSRAENELEKVIIALVEASKEVQVIEKHRESWLERSRREDRRCEQKINDEVGSIIYQRPPFESIDGSV